MGSFVRDRAIERLLQDEGGEANRPAAEDPGGRTRFGITVHRWLAEGGTLEGLETLTQAGAAQWWGDVVWDRMKLGRLKNERLATVFLNLAGPLGEPRATLCLQQALNRLSPKPTIVEDGVLGSATVEKANAYLHPAALVFVLKVEAARYLQSRPHWQYNGAGWSKRLDSL